MTKLNFNFNPDNVTGIKVIGVGGGGGNAVARMYELGIKDVEYVVCNTDEQALSANPVPTKVQLGPTICRGLGAGADHEKGEQAAQESIDEIKEHLQEDVDMLIITAGMGGGTGTGAAPIIAEAAREMGILTIAIVTKPFKFEGKKRMKKAVEGIEKLAKHVDSLLVIDNQKLFEVPENKDISMKNAYYLLDEALFKAAKGIAEIITRKGEVNLDFADVKRILENSGTLFVGIGRADGEDRAEKAAFRALETTMMELESIKNAQGALFNITSKNVTPQEIERIGEIFNEAIGSDDVEIIAGQCFEENMEDDLEIIFIAAGFPLMNSYAANPQVALVSPQPLPKNEAHSPNSQPKTPKIPFEAIEKEENFKEKIKKEALSPLARLAIMKKRGTSDLSSQQTKRHIQNIPAYKRKNIDVNAVEDTNPEGYSNVSMERDAYGNVTFRENSYYSDNAD